MIEEVVYSQGCVQYECARNLIVTTPKSLPLSLRIDW